MKHEKYDKVAASSPLPPISFYIFHSPFLILHSSKLLAHSLQILSATFLLQICLLHAASGVSHAGIFGSDEPQTPYARLRRAGDPHCVAPWARTTYGPAYCGYYAGGGAAIGGEERCPDDGTWGVDYKLWHARVRLNWFHGKYQGGEGQYEPNQRVRPFNKRPRNSM